jgi:uncharacterized protein (TIGR00369 family)
MGPHNDQRCDESQASSPMPQPDREQELFETVSQIFNERIPFNKALGLEVASLHYDQVAIRLEMREELIGNFLRGTLHGGVISSVIDVTGGLSAFMGLQKKLTGKTFEEKMAHIGKLGTIDLRVDFLRPGVRRWFICSPHALRTGNRVAVTRLELRNDADELIAVGTGTHTIA